MKLKDCLAILLLLGITTSPYAQTTTQPGGGLGFSWWRAIDVEQGPTKTELFNAYLGDLVSVAKIGYKALPQHLDETTPPYYLEQGDIIDTANPTDLAINGQGFFRVSNVDGQVFYTRAGHFTPDINGLLHNDEGFSLQPPVLLANGTENLFIDDKGILWQGVRGEQNPQQLYQFELWLPTTDAQIEREGLHFSFSNVVPAPIGTTNRIVNASLELSTTQGVKVLSQMAEILYSLKNTEAGKEKQNLDFQLYMVDFLLKEYSRSQGNLKDLERFGRLVNGVASSVAFNTEMP